MIKTLTLTMMCIVATLAAVRQAQAACPANPNVFLDGTNWAFLTEDGYAGDGAIGTFRATLSSTNPFSGTLNGTLTSNAAGIILVGAVLNGRYTVNADCLGGTLFFNVNGDSYQYTFVLASATELYLISSGGGAGNNSVGPFAGNRGRAVMLAGAAQCPAGAPALATLVGNWSFLSEDYLSASAGTFSARLPATPSVNGQLSITQTTSGVGFLDVGEVFNGTYEVYSNCSGGRLVFPYNNDSFEYEFVFAGPGKIFMVSSSTTFFSATGGVFRGRHATAVLRP